MRSLLFVFSEVAASVGAAGKLCCPRLAVKNFQLTPETLAVTFHFMKRKAKSSRPVLESRLREYGSFEKAAHHLVDRGVEVSSSYLNMIVRGSRDPSVKMARRISKALGLGFEDVVGR